MDEAVTDPDESYAEWYAWAKREVSPDPLVCLGAAQAAVLALEEGGDRKAAERAARQSIRGVGKVLVQQVGPRRRAYAEWYDWARRELGVERSCLHAAARAALRTLEAGGSSQDAAAAARRAAGQAEHPEPSPAEPVVSSPGSRVDHELSHLGPLPEPPARPDLMYGGFWRRLFALGLDCLILLFPVFVSLLLLDTPGVVDNGLAQLGWLLFWTVMLWGYFAGLESSSLQGTLGKAALGIVVTDVRGRRVSFWRASARYWAKLLSNILGIGYLLIAFTPEKRGLHDMVAGTLVVKRDYVPLIIHRSRQAPPPAPSPPGPVSPYPEPVGSQAHRG